MSNEQVRVWVDGALAGPDPVVAALDHGITVGDGVFETAKIVDGEPFALDRHHARLDRSLAGMGLPPADRSYLGEGIAAVLDGDPIAFARLRYTVTSGAGPLGSDRDDAPMTYLVAAGPQPPPPASTRIVVVGWTRNERGATTGLKTTSYAENVIALAAAKGAGGGEAVLANTRGELCEGTGTNIFVVTDGVIRTPPVTSGALAGVTRALTLEWCREEGLEVREETMPLSVLDVADEVFLTSSTRDVQGVHGIGVSGSVTGVAERELTGPGPVTEKAAQIFARLGRERRNP